MWRYITQNVTPCNTLPPSPHRTPLEPPFLTPPIPTTPIPAKNPSIRRISLFTYCDLCEITAPVPDKLEFHKICKITEENLKMVFSKSIFALFFLRNCLQQITQLLSSQVLLLLKINLSFGLWNQHHRIEKRKKSNSCLENLNPAYINHTSNSRTRTMLAFLAKEPSIH